MSDVAAVNPSRATPTVTRRGARPAVKRIAVKLTLLLGSMATALLLAEVVIRLLYGSPIPERLPLMLIEANPHRGYAMVPNTEHYTYEQHVRVNNLGLRGPDVLAKEPNEYRILVAGDSMTFGQGVAESDTIPVILEAFLTKQSEAYAKINVINGGVRGYATNQQLGLVTELAPAIEPDLVLLLWYWNDLRDGNIDGTFKRLSRKGPITFDVWGRMEGDTLDRWQRRQWLRQSALLMTLQDLRMRWTALACPPCDSSAARDSMDRLEAYLESFITLSETHGFRFVMATLPAASSLYGDDDPYQMAQQVKATAGNRGIAVIDLHESLRAHVAEAGTLPILPFDGHYDATANRIMAAHLAKAIRTYVD